MFSLPPLFRDKTRFHVLLLLTSASAADEAQNLFVRFLLMGLFIRTYVKAYLVERMQHQIAFRAGRLWKPRIQKKGLAPETPRYGTPKRGLFWISVLLQGPLFRFHVSFPECQRDNLHNVDRRILSRSPPKPPSELVGAYQVIGAHGPGRIVEFGESPIETAPIDPVKPDIWLTQPAAPWP